MVKPAQWNGTLVLDLDFANNLSAPPSVVERWMTANGYAIGGISREPVSYRLMQAVDDLLDVRARFIAKWGATPTRTLTTGNSRGSFVSRIAMEKRRTSSLARSSARAAGRAPWRCTTPSWTARGR